jgi:hypothetical protein
MPGKNNWDGLGYTLCNVCNAYLMQTWFLFYPLYCLVNCPQQHRPYQTLSHPGIQGSRLRKNIFLLRKHGAKIKYVCIVNCSVVDPKSLYSVSDPQIFFRIRIRILRLIFDMKYFLMMPLIAFMYVLEPVRYDREKSTFSSIECLICDFSFLKNCFTTVSRSKSVSKSESELFSNSDSAKTYGFSRIQIHNTGKLSTTAQALLDSFSRRDTRR